TDQNVARLNLGTDERDTRFIELGERRITDVGNVSGYFLRTQLRIAGDAGQLLDMNGGESILLHDPLGDHDGVFEVVAIPRHERHEQVLAECELAQVRRGAVRQNVTARDHITRIHQRTLVDASVLVRACVLRQVVNVDARLPGRGLVVVYANHDAR